MIVNKTSNYTGMEGFDDEQAKDKLARYVRDMDFDIKRLFEAIRGRLRFGAGTDGAKGENIAGEFQVFTSSATPDAENTIAHTLGSIPLGYIVMKQDKAASLYLGGTTWTTGNVYLKCSVASVTFTLFLVK
jgi:hypothetical protein